MFSVNQIQFKTSAPLAFGSSLNEKELQNQAYNSLKKLDILTMDKLCKSVDLNPKELCGYTKDSRALELSLYAKRESVLEKLLKKIASLKK